jgi:hypothetical protein
VFMMGLLVGQSINTMSIFSLSMDLCIQMNFFHHRYQMDDIIATLSMMMATKKRVPIRLVPLPVISGPTSGATISEEFYEWARQARRWTIGAGEVFHYFFNKLVFTRSFSMWDGLCYGAVYTHYYGFTLCSMMLFSVSSMLAPLYNGCTAADDEEVPSLLQHSNNAIRDVGGIGVLCFAISLVILILFQIIDRWAVHRILVCMGIKEQEHEWRNNFVMDCIMSWPTLLMYNVIEFYGPD